jgi:hypothetical protein
LAELAQRDAVDAARRGKPAALFEMVRSPGARKHFAPSTWELIADIGTGRFKRKVGRPRMTEEERRGINPIHDVADIVPRIERILAHYFPDQRKRDIWDKATEIAAERSEFKDVEMLRTHLRRPKGDRRRLPSQRREH